MPRYIDLEELERRIKENVPTGGNTPYEVDLLEWCKDECIRQAYAMPTSEVVPKSEVEKIFAEIEHEIDTGLSVIEKILNSKGGRATGKTVLLSKYEVFMEAKKHLNKLKKKYTEQCPDCKHFVGCEEAVWTGHCEEYDKKHTEGKK